MLHFFYKSVTLPKNIGNYGINLLDKFGKIRKKKAV